MANHGVDLWRAVNLNEVNIVENGFLQQFTCRANNLAYRPPSDRYVPPATNYGNSGLAGHRPFR